MFFGLFQGGDNGLRGLVGVPQTDGQTDQQGLGQTDGFAVHKKDVVYIGQIGAQMSGLAGAGQLAGKEDADDSVACLGSLPEIGLEQLGAGLAGGGQLAALGQAGIIFAGGQVHTVPDDGAVLKGNVEGDYGNTQQLRFSRQDVRCRIGENADHKAKPP